MGFTSAGWSEEHDVVFGGDEIQCSQMGDQVAFESTLWSKSNSSNDFRDGNRAARIRPSPPWDSRAETSRCRQATRNSSWVHDSVRARSASRGTASRIVGAFRALVRKLISAVRSRLLDVVGVLVLVVM